MKKPVIWALLVLSCSLILHNQLLYQPILSTGDHGRDLYAAAATMDGQAPYRDYWWVYGPLTPYYYSLFLKLFGVNISSVLMGGFVLDLLSGLCFFSILSFFSPVLFAFVATLWFLSFKLIFYFTYNHMAGMTCLLAIICFLLHYHFKRRVKFLYFALFAAFALFLVKINFGVLALATLLLFVYLSERMDRIPASKSTKRFYLLATVGMPSAVIIIYWALLHSLPPYAIRQCLPYMPSFLLHIAPLSAIFAKWLGGIALGVNMNWSSRILAIFFALCALHIIRNLYKQRFNGPWQKNFIYAAILFASFYFLALHEYFIGGLYYRIIWVTPFSMLFVFLFIGTAMKDFRKEIQWLIILVLFASVLMHFRFETARVETLRRLNKGLGLARANIFTNNPDDWKATVWRTTTFLMENIPEEETFLALPYDPLYYFLTDRKSPTRQLIFFDHENIPEEQEEIIIQEIEDKNVNYVLISNRCNAREPGLGVFGETYCPLLFHHLKKNFETFATIGNWNVEPGWGWNHAVTILKRKEENIQ